MGEAGVTVRAEKEGVNDLDHRIRPPEDQLLSCLMVSLTHSDGI